jgi:hypothetical protein
MATTLTVNGTGYSFPAVGDRNWGANVSNWAAAVTSGMLQKAGGSFVLTAEVDFGATYGLKSAYFKSRATTPGSAGAIRLGNAENITWRNQAGGADLSLTVNSSNLLAFNSIGLVDLSSTQTLTNKTLTSPIISSLTLTGQVVFDAGSNAAPTITTTGDLDTGLYFSAADTVNITTGGTFRLEVSSTAVTSRVKQFGIDGLVSAPTYGFESDDDTGMYYASGLAFATAGVKRLGIDLSGLATFSAGLTVVGTTTLDTGLTGLVKASSGVVSAATLVNADVSASAAIAFSKLATLTDSNILVGSSGNVATAVAVTGDVTIGNTGVTAIASGVILNADVNASAAIAGTKISPNFGSQVVQTTGNLTINTDAFAVDASGKIVTIGATGGTVTHIINGNQLNFVGGTSNTQAQLFFNNSNAGNTTNSIFAMVGPASQSGNNLHSVRRSSDSATAWSWGQNNGSSGRFEIAQGSSALGTNSFLTITTAGAMGLGVAGQDVTVNGNLVVTGTQATTIPTSMSNANATALGYKEFLHGTTYNGGIAPTVTSSVSGWTVDRAAFYPYQDQAGSWYMRMSINGTYTANSHSLANLTINGVTFANEGTCGHALAMTQANSATLYINYCDARKNSSIVEYQISVATSGLILTITGWARLASKPTWAY